jgi:hypothetical protein
MDFKNLLLKGGTVLDAVELPSLKNEVVFLVENGIEQGLPEKSLLALTRCYWVLSAIEEQSEQEFLKSDKQLTLAAERLKKQQDNEVIESLRNMMRTAKGSSGRTHGAWGYVYEELRKKTGLDVYQKYANQNGLVTYYAEAVKDGYGEELTAIVENFTGLSIQ